MNSTDADRQYMYNLARTLTTPANSSSQITQPTSPDPSLEGTDYTPDLRRREWNRSALTDLFPRIPSAALERVLDICIDRKDFVYNLSESKRWNARRYTSIVVAHVRHSYTDYDKLLREEKVERYAARHKTSQQVWKVLREWCPWDDSNEVLEQCFQVTLLRPEERDPSWDPMDLDDESDYGDDDPMDID